MSLCVPLVVGPVTELMTAVRVQGALPGATVVVEASGAAPRVVAKGIASGGDDWFGLLAGEQLLGGDRLTAKQTLAGDSSPATPAQLAVNVAAAPSSAAELGYIGAKTHLYQCGAAVWLTGIFPGARAELSWGGTAHGSAVAGPDGARFSLDSGLPSGSVTLRQVAPVGSGPDAAIRPDPTPAGADHRLPMTKVGAPLVACQTAVLVTDVVDGATVTLRHKDSSTQQAPFDLSGLWFRIPPLVQGDTVVARQEMVPCELESGDSAPPVGVGSASGLPAPTVLEPLCVGAVSIRVTGLVPGALVHLKVSGQQYTGMAPPSRNWADFFVAPLTAGTVTATQEACSVTSHASQAVTVHTQPAVTTPVKITAPLLECGRAVAVTDAHIGGLLQIWAKSSTDNAPISGIVVADATEVSLPVSPYLRKGDAIRVVQYGCSSTAVPSAEVVVNAHAAPTPPKVASPAYAEHSDVIVVGVVPGALVDVYLSRREQPWRFVGSTVAASDKPDVHLTMGLEVGDHLRATQTLCSSQTEPGPVTVAVAPPPKVPIITSPTNGAVGVPKRPTFTWKDGGAGSAAAATSYELQLLDGTTSVIGPTAVNGTSFTPPQDLNFTRKLTLQVRAKNASGSSSWSQVVFTTQAAPTPVAPILTKYDVATHVLTGSGFLHSATVHVRLSMVGSSIQNSYGQWIPDTRDVIRNFTSDASGNLSATIDPKTALPALLLDDQYYAYGVVSGELLHFSANDGRPNPANITGTLWSNTLNVTAP
jgi:hypothetical protein